MVISQSVLIQFSIKKHVYQNVSVLQFCQTSATLVDVIVKFLVIENLIFSFRLHNCHFY